MFFFLVGVTVFLHVFSVVHCPSFLCNPFFGSALDSIFLVTFESLSTVFIFVLAMQALIRNLTFSLGLDGAETCVWKS